MFKVASFILFLALTTNVSAQGCRSIQNASDRLECYDARERLPAATNGNRINIIDFKTDKRELQGRSVEVEGLLMNFGDRGGVLMATLGDTNGVIVDVSKVDREQRRKMLACTSPCKAIVKGKVGTVAVMQIGIIAEAVSIE